MTFKIWTLLNTYPWAAWDELGASLLCPPDGVLSPLATDGDSLLIVGCDALGGAETFIYIFYLTFKWQLFLYMNIITYLHNNFE